MTAFLVLVVAVVRTLLLWRYLTLHQLYFALFHTQENAAQETSF